VERALEDFYHASVAHEVLWTCDGTVMDREFVEADVALVDLR
jgi:hypothetical protein